MKNSGNGVSPSENPASGGRKVIITCAVTGSIHTPTMSGALPVTAEEIAEASIEAARAGAAIIHLHARDPETGRPSAEPGHFRPFLEQIAKETDAIVNISTGGSSVMPLDARLAPAREMEPEMCSLNMGSMNFGTFPMLDKYSGWKHNWEPELLAATRGTVFKNTFEDIEAIIEDLGEQRGAKFEFECYDLGQIETLGFYVKRGLIKPPLYIQFVLGVLGGAGASPENLVAMKNCADRVIPCEYHFSVLAAGGKQMAMATMGAIMGGNVRVGLEDNLTISPGVLAESNAQQVAKIRRIIEDLGLEAASADETRSLLALKGRNKVNF